MTEAKSVTSQRIKFQIGVSHIERGVPQNRRSCPIALALRDGHCKGWAKVIVDFNGVSLLWDEQALGSKWKLSPAALTFLTLFDSGQKTAAAMLAAREASGFYIEKAS